MRYAGLREYIICKVWEPERPRGIKLLRLITKETASSITTETAFPKPPEVAYDVLIIGSGAAGLSTAIVAHERGLKVLLVEKEARFGGTTVRSGGWIWAPRNPLAVAEGIEDSLDDAETYIRHEAGAAFDPARASAFLANAGPMVEFFLSRTQVRFALGENYPDYHPDHPGAVETGRSLRTQPFDGRKLGPAIADLAAPMRESSFLGMGLNSGPDLKHFLNATRSWRSALFVLGRIVDHAVSMARFGRGIRLVNGCALAAQLLATAQERQIELWHSAPALELVSRRGRVIGALVARGGELIKVNVRRGVVLAAGGFPRDERRRRVEYAHLHAGTTHLSLAPSGNSGDGVKLGESVGAGFTDKLKNAAAWAPVSMVHYRDGSEGRFFHLIDRAKPGVIAVLENGMRFVNESENYHDFVRAMIDAAGNSEACAFLICDHRALRRYGLGAVRPFPIPYGRFLKSGYLKAGKSIEELAAHCGIDAGNLQNTVARLNRDAVASGTDSVYGKGSTSYQRLLGDADFAPNPCIAPIASAPFYAVKIYPGDLGTYHGLSTDENARVISAKGAAIRGLYAVGNDAASVFGGSYPGAGATLGPAMTFGYICGNDLANRESVSDAAPDAALTEHRPQTEATS